uniref:Methyltransferase domain-containing protein n=1 Tax=Acrobeloides nanus TaxID=290746 RepID=A0A914C0Z4_9BILA
MFQLQSIDRRKVLANNNLDWTDYYSVIVPEVLCNDILRVGRVVDGGKWVCNPIKIRHFKEGCVIYSFGISNELSFDEAIQNFTQQRCVLKAIDKFKQNSDTIKQLEKIRGVFKQVEIANITNQDKNQYSFSDVVSTFGDKRIEILKIDIEGAEYQVIDQILSIPICQILIETHSMKISAKKTFELIQKIAKSGFYLFAFQINGAFHPLAEYGFIHEKCFETYGLTTVYGRYLD